MHSRLLLRRFLLFLVAALCVVLCSDGQSCPTGYAVVTATKIGALTPLLNGLMTVEAIGPDQNAINYSVPGLGVELMTPKRRPVVNGVLTGATLCLPRTDSASVRVGYHFVVRDSSSAGANRIVLDVTNVPILADSFSLDTYDFHSSSSPFVLASIVTLPVSSSNQVLIALGAGSYAWANLPDCQPGSHALNYTASTHTFSCSTVTGTSGGSDGSGSTSTPGLLIDATTGVYYALSFASGSLTINATTSSAGTGAAGVELIDTVTAVHYTLSTNNGSLTTQPTSSPGTGVSALTLSDTVSGHVYTLVIANGALTTT